MSERTPDQVALLPGDGGGQETGRAARRLIGCFDGIETTEYPFGFESIKTEGKPLTDEVIAGCEGSDAVLLGAVGTPPEEITRLEEEGGPTPEDALLELRKLMEAFANLRPVEDYFPPLEDRPEVDLLLVRELLGGEYRGDGGILTEDYAEDKTSYWKWEIERIAEVAFAVAKARAAGTGQSPRLASADKSNIQNTGKLWRRTVTEIGGQHPDVELSHYFVDNMAMQLAARPEQFEVILASNLPGDILSDLSAGRVHGSLGLAPSASLGKKGRPGTDIFESVHGATFDIAGQGKVNPLATFFSVELMLRYALDRPEDADDLRAALLDVLQGPCRTADMVPAGREAGYQVVSTEEMTDVVVDALAARLAARQAG